MSYENNDQTESTKPNNQPKNTDSKLFTDETFAQLTQALKDIREQTKPQSKALLFETNNDEINQAKNDIEKQSGFAPSYKKLINQISSKENIEQAKQRLISHINENKLNGYSPDFQLLVNEIMNSENINQAKQNMLETFELLNS